MKFPRLLILGNGGAAVHAMIAMRSAGHKGPICLVSDTDGAAFNPMLSPYYLKGKINWYQCFPFGENLYGKYDVTCHFNARVDSLDAVNRSVFLANGLKLDYDRCLIATGARPVVKREWLGSWANACYQGRTAGLSMLDRYASYPGSITQHVSPFFDLTFVQIGDPLRQGQNVQQISGGSLKQGRYHMLLFEDEVLVGVNLLNDSQWAGRLKAAIVRRLAWSRYMPRSNANSFKEIEQSLNLLDYIGEMA